MERQAVDVLAREAAHVTPTPFGEVGLLHEGDDLSAWWVWKDEEDVDPSLAVASREDFVLVLRGALRLELAGREAQVLQAGECAVIPRKTPFRGYRWPRDGEPCLFVAVAPADAVFSAVAGPPAAS